MQATDFEFRHRFWFIGAIFGVAFWLYAVDPVNTAVFLVRSLGRPDEAVRAVFALATLLLTAAALLRTWATAWLNTEVVHDDALHAEGMVADGPYRYVRNPLYLALWLLAAGMGLVASRLGFVVLVFGMLAFILRLIGREEAQLSATQGEPYRRFCAAVPRLFPSPTPRLPASGARARWGQAWAGEAYFWGFVLAMAMLTLTLNATWSYGISGVSLVLYALLMPVWRARLAASNARERAAGR